LARSRLATVSRLRVLVSTSSDRLQGGGPAARGCGIVPPSPARSDGLGRGDRPHR